MVHPCLQFLFRIGDEGRLVGLLQELLEDVVDDGAVVVRAEGGPLPGLGVQAVAAEVLEGAVVVVVHSGGRQVHVLPEELCGDGRVFNAEGPGPEHRVQRLEFLLVSARLVETGEGLADRGQRSPVFRADLFCIGLIGGTQGLRMVVELQGFGVLGPVAFFLRLAVFIVDGEQPLDRRNEFGGQVAVAGEAQPVPREVEPLRGRRDRGIGDEPLFTGPQVFREGELETVVAQVCPLVEREKA